MSWIFLMKSNLMKNSPQNKISQPHFKIYLKELFDKRGNSSCTNVRFALWVILRIFLLILKTPPRPIFFNSLESIWLRCYVFGYHCNFSLSSWQAKELSLWLFLWSFFVPLLVKGEIKFSYNCNFVHFHLSLTPSAYQSEFQMAVERWTV